MWILEDCRIKQTTTTQKSEASVNLSGLWVAYFGSELELQVLILELTNDQHCCEWSCKSECSPFRGPRSLVTLDVIMSTAQDKIQDLFEQ
jgi:hypothetical protein